MWKYDIERFGPSLGSLVCVYDCFSVFFNQFWFDCWLLCLVLEAASNKFVENRLNLKKFFGTYVNKILLKASQNRIRIEPNA